MEIDTGDSPPITQRSYTLPLKHATWVQKELEILEKAGVIIRSVSPWASPHSSSTKELWKNLPREDYVKIIEQ